MISRVFGIRSPLGAAAGFLTALVLCASPFFASAAAKSKVNQPTGDQGMLPTADDGHPLNFNFEKGTLEDWKAEGDAFKDQPVKGPIDPKRPFSEGKHADYTGDYWIGGFEKKGDEATGTLTSVPFKVTQPYASFLLGGGSHKGTRVELVRDKDKKVIFTAHGKDDETMLPVVVDLRPYKDTAIFIRLVDEDKGGWGHLNFDDFRVYKAEPKFKVVANAGPAPDIDQLYPFAGLEPEKAAEVMELPAGFKVQVAAAEPDVKQPIAMAFDHRGRLWIAEAYEYPRKAPEGQGHDRILIFEDTTGNGKFDKRTVFAEHLNLVSGLQVSFGGVWVGAAPQLLFIPDRNGDDVPDGPPEVVLDGWGYQDTHETLNTFTWGPDGWLYGCQGVFTQSNVGKPGAADADRVRLNACIWRLHPVTKKFEVFAEGTSNPWGIDFNDHGQAFCTACVIPHLYHIIQGARYQRQAGNHLDPYTYDDIKTIADHLHYLGNQWNDVNRRQSDELGGGHAHAGAMIYLGGSWPDRYRDQIFMNNILGNRINQDRLTSHGSGYIGSHGPDFILTRDQWSQILHLEYGPDGQVWMIDWYDKNQCHNADPAVHDRTNGRIFRVSYNGAHTVKVDLNKRTDAELIALLTNKNEWYPRHARQLLQERTAAKKLDSKTRPALAQLLLALPQDAQRLRILWALHATGGLPSELIPRLLADGSPYVRGWTIQLLLENPAHSPTAAQLALMEKLAIGDESPIVRLYLASALQRLPPERRWGILEGLLSHGADSADHNLPLMYWYAAEPLAQVDPRRALAMALAAGEKFPELTSFMVRRIGAGDQNKALALLLDGLKESKDDPARLVFLRGLNESLKGKREIAAPAAWGAIRASLAKSATAEVRLQADALALTFGDKTASDALRQIAADAKAQPAARREAIQYLVKAKDAKLVDLLYHLLKDNVLRGDAIRALAAFDDPRTAQAILAAYEDLPPPERRDALATLCSRPPYALALLTAIEQKQIAATQLTADLVRQLRNLNNADLSRRIEQVWGTVRESAADKIALKEAYKKIVLEPQAPPADLELGRALFAHTCQQCHTLFGVGGKVGPDLTGSNRANPDYLLAKVTDPSAVVTKAYQASMLRLSDGRVITGIVKSSDGGALTVQTANELVTVPKTDIEEQKLSDKSMMPEEQFKPLTRHEIRSLVGYLASRGQTSMLATDDNVKGFFDGKDLTGWRSSAGVWSVAGGVLSGRAEKSRAFLLSDLVVEDFHLAFEARLPEGSGAIGLRVRRGGDDFDRGAFVLLGAGQWGKLTVLNSSASHDSEKSPEAKDLKLTDWNKVEISAIGARVRVWINGVLTTDREVDVATDNRRGALAFELQPSAAAELQLRRLDLKLNPKPPILGGNFPMSKGGVKGKVAFKKHVLDTKFRSEGVAYGDFNNDGLLDIAAGSVWFEAPDWKMHSILEQPKEFSPRVYSESFFNWAEDVAGHGRQDLVVVDFPGKQTWWFENPGPAGGPWARHLITPVTNNESPAYLDLFGQGRRELIFGFSGKRMGYARPADLPDAPWRMTTISEGVAPSTDQFSHGLGVGDVNGDGRLDVVTPDGWWEQPEIGAKGPWKFHEAKLGEPQAEMFVYDFNGDGKADVLGSSPHRTGIWWHEQTADGWKTHEIDHNIAQTHALRMADINGDGLPDFVVGKRYFAHNGNDPGENQPPTLFWYEFSRKAGVPTWTPHLIDSDSGVGTQFEVVDMNGDGLLDIVISNKRGTFYFEQVRE
ncbi:MAG TPA: PVC-type heme-binding CxxCH protein [Pirellulales bacterium]|jgi:putative membrane-bound dehydrogenase-like protein|nr:PVC-type heme-binding CxxCH protein [Pirellulales bacterium]